MVLELPEFHCCNKGCNRCGNRPFLVTRPGGSKSNRQNSQVRHDGAPPMPLRAADATAGDTTELPGTGSIPGPSVPMMPRRSLPSPAGDSAVDWSVERAFELWGNPEGHPVNVCVDSDE